MTFFKILDHDIYDPNSNPSAHALFQEPKYNNNQNKTNSHAWRKPPESDTMNFLVSQARLCYRTQLSSWFTSRRCLPTATQTVVLDAKQIKDNKLVTRPSRVRVHKKFPKLKWESVIGLEVHAQINSKSKLFSASPASCQDSVNDGVSFFDASFPGTLPSINRKCVIAGIKTALALNSNVNLVSEFDRKHYFYADLPTGYQITQQRRPLAQGGRVDFVVLKSSTVPVSYEHSVGITQIQLEQDSGKSYHDDVENQSLIDLNRAGVGLMEIVFEPAIFDGEEAASLIKELALILKRLDVCTCRMEDGALRVDANISVRPVKNDGDLHSSKENLHNLVCGLGVRTEVKNLNSIRSVVRAIEYEVDRQIVTLANGGVVENETRSFDFEAKKTLSMRDKEAKQDYRFIPEPNLPPLRLCDQNEPGNMNPDILNVNDFRLEQPELPADRRRLLAEKFGLSTDNVVRMVNNSEWLDYFFECVQFKPDSPNQLAEYIVTALVHHVNEAQCSFKDLRIRPEDVVNLANMRTNEELPTNLITQAFRTLLETDEFESLAELLERKKWRETFRDRDRITKEVLLAIASHPRSVKYHLKGKSRGFDELMRALNRTLRQDSDMKFVGKILREELSKMKLK